MADYKDLTEATAQLSFAEFLERMKDPAAADLVRSIKNFIKTFNERKPEPDKDSQLVQQFLAKSEVSFRQHPVWAAGPVDHQAQAIEGLEKYLMTKIYQKTFAVSALDRERDEALGTRMAALNFIKPQHLDIPPAFHDEKAWLLAMKELHKINSYKAPRDKLVCILNCCRIINNLLHVTVQQGEARGADDFLPILIYVVIHANPPQLASNLEYIQRFRMQSRMVSESSYFFTQLYSAASFIETISSNSLSMDADEFVARMVAAGVPDMQLLPEAQRQAKLAHVHEQSRGVPLKASPLGTALQASGGPPHSAPAALAIPAPPWQGVGVEELQRRGAAYVLEADRSGELQARHPFLYAAAENLRVTDVEALLGAYKRLVLKYEALSLAIARMGPWDSSETPVEFPNALQPAVTGPNPFSDWGGEAARSRSNQAQAAPDLLSGEPRGDRAAAAHAELASLIAGDGGAAMGGSSRAAAAGSTAGPSSQDLAQQQAEMKLPLPLLSSVKDHVAPIQEATPSAHGMPPGYLGDLQSLDSGRLDASVRVLSMVTEDARSAAELRMEQEQGPEQAGLPHQLLGIKAQPQQQLAAKTSELAMPRPDLSTPFEEAETETQAQPTEFDGVELPWKSVVPNPFAESLEGVEPEPSSLPRPSPVSPLAQPVEEVVPLPQPQVVSPFDAQDPSEADTDDKAEVGDHELTQLASFAASPFAARALRAKADGRRGVADDQPPPGEQSLI